MSAAALRAPFPWFGGKSRAASLVWAALGDVTTYVEPFAGSLAVLLARPSVRGLETANDRDCYLANFWRALKSEPDAVAEWADQPINEADLHARHLWLIGQSEFRERVLTDPDFYDAKVAGWWAWGISQWIGDGWCGEGKPSRKLPNIDGAGGKGLCSSDGVNLPRLRALARRLSKVRVACGDWTRVLGGSALRSSGVCGVFLDPPYADGAMEYAAGGMGTGISSEVRAWAVANGDRRDLRVVLAGYDGEHPMPAGWRSAEWTAGRGFSGEANDNRHRERLWLSPHCLDATRQPSLFGGAA